MKHRPIPPLTSRIIRPAPDRIADLAIVLTRTDTNLEHTINVLRDMAAVGYPDKASGAQRTPDHRPPPTQPDGKPRERPGDPPTATERAALWPDQDAIWARQRLNSIHLVLAGLTDMIDALDQIRTEPPAQPCPTCGHPLNIGAVRCQREGCNSHSQTIWCENPHHTTYAKGRGERFRRARCMPCYEYLKKHGRDRIPTEGLDLGDNIIITDQPDSNSGDE